MSLLDKETLRSYIDGALNAQRNAHLKFVRGGDQIWVDTTTVEHRNIWGASEGELKPEDAGRLSIKPRLHKIEVYASSSSLDVKEIRDERLNTISILQALVNSLAENDSQFEVVIDETLNSWVKQVLT